MYGMTPGELALLINNEFLDQPCTLFVVPMANHSRRMRQQDTGLPWVPTSTHIPQAGTALYYSLTGVIGEIGRVNTGVGYTLPFECLAAPWIDRDALVNAINAENIPDLRARPISYQPRYAAYTGQTVHGAHLMITDQRALRPFSAQIVLMEILQSLYPEHNIFDRPGAEDTLFDRALGTDHIRLMIARGENAEAVLQTLAPASRPLPRCAANISSADTERGVADRAITRCPSTGLLGLRTGDQALGCCNRKGTIR